MLLQEFIFYFIPFFLIVFGMHLQTYQVISPWLATEVEKAVRN